MATVSRNASVHCPEVRYRIEIAKRTMFSLRPRRRLAVIMDNKGIPVRVSLDMIKPILATLHNLPDIFLTHEIYQGFVLLNVA